DPETRGPSQAMIAGRKKGIFFDVGHGGGSFQWSCAIPLMKAGFVPDSISTDLHRSSASRGMKDMLNVMSKFLAMGMSLDEVILRSTWNPAKQIKHEELGHLSPGAVADIAVLRLENGKFGFLDEANLRVDGTRKLVAEMTLRDGKIVYDLNGVGRGSWETVPFGQRPPSEPLWDGLANQPSGARPRRTTTSAK
ncbi:MAG TPA: amidohydrolase family protein, partial [Bryobacteraceae bacterium]|nr:amidohydrolase family protein [Bryobacteraceae bacterium]